MWITKNMHCMLPADGPSKSWTLRVSQSRNEVSVNKQPRQLSCSSSDSSSARNPETAKKLMQTLAWDHRTSEEAEELVLAGLWWEAETFFGRPRQVCVLSLRARSKVRAWQVQDQMKKVNKRGGKDQNSWERSSLSITCRWNKELGSTFRWSPEGGS